MISAKLRSLLTVFASIVLVTASQVGGHVYAASTSAAKSSASSVTNSANSLKISQPRNDITLAPGATGTVQVLVTNLANYTVQLKPIENDFIAGDEKGTPALILDENSYAPSHSLKRFMVPLQNITIAAGQTATVTVTIKVPASAQAGGYFGALRVTPATGNGGSSVNLNPSVASLILLTVPGPTTELVTLSNFDIQQNGGTASNFRTPTDLSVLLRFQNKGNLQEAPFGLVYAQKGKKVVYSYNFNQTPPKNEILPDSARRWTIPLKNIGKFSKYTVGATFTYGTKGQSIEVTKTIWIIPTAYILAGVISLAALIVIVVGFWVFIRSYKRRILRSSRRRY